MTKIGYTSNDLLNLAKYATGAGVNHYDLNLGTGVAGYVIFDGAVKGSKWLMDNKTNFKEQGFLKTLKNSVKAADDLQQSLKGGNLLQTAKNFSKNNTLRELAQKYQAFKKLPASEAAKLTGTARLKYLQNIAKSDFYKDVRKLIREAGKLSGDAYKVKLKEIYEAIAKADLNIHAAKVSGELAPLGKTSKLWNSVKKATGLTKLSKGAKELAVKSSTFRTVSKAVKGNALFAGISLLAEAPEICTTYSQLGSKAGTKQLARSVVNVAAETAGFAIGMKAGAAAGAAIGTCIPIPGVGTAVGAVVGAAVGLLGSWLAGKASRAVVGESELQNHNDYNAKVIALKAKFDKNFEKELLAATEQKLSQDNMGQQNAEVISTYKRVAQAQTA